MPDKKNSPGLYRLENAVSRRTKWLERLVHGKGILQTVTDPRSFNGEGNCDSTGEHADCEQGETSP